MQGLPTITGEFTLVDDPDLRFTSSGTAVSNMRLITNGRRFNKATQEWEDHGMFVATATVWREYAENCAESLRKGDRVLVTGLIETRQWEDNEGNKRQAYEIQVEEIGPTLRFRKVLHTNAAGEKVTREGASAEPSADDPWATQ
jgi:single-strand DNA-binding protein